MANHKRLFNKDGSPRKTSYHRNYTRTRYYNPYFNKDGSPRKPRKPRLSAGSSGVPRISKSDIEFLSKLPDEALGIGLIIVSSAIFVLMGVLFEWSFPVLGSISFLLISTFITGVVFVVIGIYNRISENTSWRNTRRKKLLFTEASQEKREEITKVQVGPIFYDKSPIPNITVNGTTYALHSVKNIERKEKTICFVFGDENECFECSNDNEAQKVLDFIKNKLDSF